MTRRRGRPAGPSDSMARRLPELRRFADEGTPLSEIAARFGITKQRASCILKACGLREQWWQARSAWWQAKRARRFGERINEALTYPRSSILHDAARRLADAGHVVVFDVSDYGRATLAVKVDGVPLRLSMPKRPHKLAAGLATYYRTCAHDRGAHYLMALPDGRRLVYLGPQPGPFIRVRADRESERAHRLPDLEWRSTAEGPAKRHRA